ncbi:hypothetical protein LG634_09520 [Streptomyces bambusae]|uniref:hypothetical protein n=1 Tax=Streptomyces bambusae TaxID=1550616 RepID=UPI001CFE358B|nr:hypothetical protein [Streptomyces bambusae]MCB5165066.1 hypothetical protein [Streptomyces bambusae]
MDWKDLSTITGYPSSAAAGTPCSVSIEAQGNDAYVKTITTTGQVYQLQVDVTGMDFDPDIMTGWVLQTPGPAPGPALRHGRAVPEGAPPFS